MPNDDGEDKIECIYSLNNIPLWNNLESLKIWYYGGWEWWVYSDQSGMDNFFCDLVKLNFNNLKRLYHNASGYV